MNERMRPVNEAEPPTTSHFADEIEIPVLRVKHYRKPEKRETSAVFTAFTTQMKYILEGKAKDKAYNTTGVDGPNDLYDFITRYVGPGEEHALGEIVYKVVRFKAKGDVEDLEKAACWAFLAWRSALQKQETLGQTKQSEEEPF